MEIEWDLRNEISNHRAESCIIILKSNRTNLPLFQQFPNSTSPHLHFSLPDITEDTGNCKRDTICLWTYQLLVPELLSSLLRIESLETLQKVSVMSAELSS